MPVPPGKAEVVGYADLVMDKIALVFFFEREIADGT